MNNEIAKLVLRNAIWKASEDIEINELMTITADTLFEIRRILKGLNLTKAEPLPQESENEFKREIVKPFEDIIEKSIEINGITYNEEECNPVALENISRIVPKIKSGTVATFGTDSHECDAKQYFHFDVSQDFAFSCINDEKSFEQDAKEIDDAQRYRDLKNG